MNDARKKGIRLEMLVEMMLHAKANKDNGEGGIYNVRRDVEIHRERYVFRQCDVTYDIVRKGKLYRCMIEAKYSSNGQVPDFYRTPMERKLPGGKAVKISGPLDQAYETGLFGRFDMVFLLTNSCFSKELSNAAKRHRVGLIENEGLQKIYNRYMGRGDVNAAIKTIDVSRDRNRKSMIYIS